VSESFSLIERFYRRPSQFVFVLISNKFYNVTYFNSDVTVVICPLGVMCQSAFMNVTYL